MATKLNSHTAMLLAMIDSHRRLLDALEHVIASPLDASLPTYGADFGADLTLTHLEVRRHAHGQIEVLAATWADGFPREIIGDDYRNYLPTSMPPLPSDPGDYAFDSFDAEHWYAMDADSGLLKNPTIVAGTQPSSEAPPAHAYIRPKGAPKEKGPKPAIKFIDPDGVGWREMPDFTEAWSEDKGQHDSWKIELRVALYRFAHGIPNGGSFDLSLVKLPQRLIQTGRLFPFEDGLSNACKRLGFARLARAAFETMGGPWDTSTEAGEQCLTLLLQNFYADHEAAVQIEANRRAAVNAKTAAGWNPLQGPFNPETVEQTIAMLTLGPFDGPDLPVDKTLMPLTPL